MNSTQRQAAMFSAMAIELSFSDPRITHAPAELAALIADALALLPDFVEGADSGAAALSDSFERIARELGA